MNLAHLPHRLVIYLYDMDGLDKNGVLYNLLMTASVKEEVVAVPAKSPVLFSGPDAMVDKTAF